MSRWRHRRQLQALLAQRTHCTLQHTGWPCNTCFFVALQRHLPADDLLRMWHATLLVRGDYHNGDVLAMPRPLLLATLEQLLAVLTVAEGSTAPLHALSPTVH